jgi:hypothetical protein
MNEQLRPGVVFEAPTRVSSPFLSQNAPLGNKNLSALSRFFKARSWDLADNLG